MEDGNLYYYEGNFYYGGKIIIPKEIFEDYNTKFNSNIIEIESKRENKMKSELEEILDLLKKEFDLYYYQLINGEFIIKSKVSNSFTFTILLNIDGDLYCSSLYKYIDPSNNLSSVKTERAVSNINDLENDLRVLIINNIF